MRCRRCGTAGCFVAVVRPSVPALLRGRRGRVRVAGILVEPDRAGLEALAALAAEGKLRPHVERTFPLEEAGARARAGRDRAARREARAHDDLMARFVLVHGAFGGAWCWEPVIGLLEAAGHTVETLDLPGGGGDGTPVEEVTLESCVDACLRACSSRVRSRRFSSVTAWAASSSRRPRPIAPTGSRRSSSSRVHARERPEPARPRATSRRAQAT